MKRGRANVFRDKDDLDGFRFGHTDNTANLFNIFFVVLIHCDGNELKVFCLRLLKESLSIFKSEVAPGFAKGRFHIFDQ